MQRTQDKPGYYSDGVTRYTDPFYRGTCSMCGYEFWSVLKSSKCPQCGGTVYEDKGNEEKPIDAIFESYMSHRKNVHRKRKAVYASIETNQDNREEKGYDTI